MLKKNIYSKFLCCIALISATSFASAAGYDIYVTGKGGYSHVGDLSKTQNLKDGNTKVVVLSGYKFDPAFNFGIAIGKHCRSLNMRVELDIHHTRVQAKDMNSSLKEDGTEYFHKNALTLKSKGELDVTFYGANVYYDLTMLPMPALVPYIGIGAGISNINFKDKKLTGPKPENDVILEKDTKINETQFTFQLMLGAQYYFNKTMSVLLEYNFSHVNTFKYNTDFAKTTYGKQIKAKNFEDALMMHSVNVGFKAIIA